MVRKYTEKRDHLEGVVVDRTMILKCLGDVERDNDHTDLLKYQREVPLLANLVS